MAHAPINQCIRREVHGIRPGREYLLYDKLQLCKVGNMLDRLSQRMVCDPRSIESIEGEESWEWLNPVFAASFANTNGSLLACCDEEGQFSMINVEKSRIVEGIGWDDALFDVQWSRDDSKLAFGAANSCLIIHNVGSGEYMVLDSLHRGSIRSVRFHPKSGIRRAVFDMQCGVAEIVATGGRDGLIGLWDLRTCSKDGRTSRPSNVLSGVHRKGGVKGSVACLAYVPQREHLIASVGQPEYSVRFWDCRYVWGRGAMAVPVEQIDPPTAKMRSRAFSHIAFDSCGARLFAQSSDDRIYAYLVSNFSSTPLRVYEAPGFKSGSFYLKCKVSPDDRFLASGSKDGTTFLWDVEVGDGAIGIAGHNGEVTALDWSIDGKLATGGEDGQLRFWSFSDLDSDNVNKGLVQLVQSSSDRLISYSVDFVNPVDPINPVDPANPVDPVNSVNWKGAIQTPRRDLYEALDNLPTRNQHLTNPPNSGPRTQSDRPRSPFASLSNQIVLPQKRQTTLDLYSIWSRQGSLKANLL